MAQTRDWQRNRDMWIRVLERQTGESLDDWNRRIRKQRFADEASLRLFLTDEGVTGYAQQLLLMERFGYPDFVTSTAGELIDAQYSDRPNLRPIHDDLVKAASALGEIIIQARKTYVSLVSPRRTFARLRPATRSRLDLGLRLDGVKPHGRLRPSTMHETMQLQIELTSREEIDADVRRWLKQAYEQNS